MHYTMYGSEKRCKSDKAALIMRRASALTQKAEGKTLGKH